ncbi:MAG: hypothetical protein ACLTC4_11575 [Hungatella hathewayi]
MYTTGRAPADGLRRDYLTPRVISTARYPPSADNSCVDITIDSSHRVTRRPRLLLYDATATA